MADADPAPLQFAGFTLDPAAHTLVDASGRGIPLRRSKYELLRAFLAAPGRALSRDHLLDAWPVAAPTRISVPDISVGRTVCLRRLIGGSGAPVVSCAAG